MRHPLLALETGLDIRVKHENHNPTGAFKVRGGLNLIASLPAEDRRGVITAEQVGRALRDEGYSFVTPTPETHRRVLNRGGEARGLRDVFGWSKPFAPGFLPRRIEALLDSAGALRRDGALLRSTVRFSSLEAFAC